MHANRATDGAAAPLPWRRGVAWLLLLGPFFFLSYGYANQLAAAKAVHGAVYFGWERQIPFWPWTIVPYWSIDLLYGFSFLCCRTPRDVDRHALRLLTAQCLAVACFIAFPLRFAFERPVSDGVFGAMFDALTSFDQPYNQAPSLHIALLVLIWVQFARLSWPAWARVLVHGWAVLIGLSVLTTWQHHLIDVPTGAALGLLCLWCWPDAPHAAPWRRDRQGDPRARRRLAWRYAFGAGLACAVAFWFGGLGGPLAWVALALMLVAWSYAWCGAAGFQKQAGRQSLAVRWLMAPYLAAAWLNARWWTRRDRRAQEVADGVWLGPMPSAAEWRAGAYTGLVDLTGEMRAPRAAKAVVSVPRLDLVAPDAAQLAEAALAIEAARHAGGKVLVACALGYARSASAVAAWWCAQADVPDASAAVERVRAARPQVVLDAACVPAIAAAARRVRETASASVAASARTQASASTDASARAEVSAVSMAGSAPSPTAGPRA